MSLFIDTLVETVTDGVEDTCETHDEKVDALESVIHALTLHLRDLTGKTEPAYRRTAAVAGLGVAAGMLEVVADREAVTAEALDALTPEDVTHLYDAFIGPAVDRIEQHLLDPQL